VTAAVVGVILNLAVWFALHVLLPEAKAVDLYAMTVSIVAFAGMLRWKWGIIPVVFGAGLLGMIYKLLLPV
jgi:chromate transporter